MSSKVIVRGSDHIEQSRRNSGSSLANFDANMRKSHLSRSQFGSFVPLEEVLSKASDEADSLLDKDLFDHGTQNNKQSAVFDHRKMSQETVAKKADVQRKGMKELFRARLINNRGKNDVEKLSQQVHRRQNWNYIVGYDGNEAYKPPSHIPLKKKENNVRK